MFNSIFRLIFPAKSATEIIQEFDIPSEIRFKFETRDGYIIATSDDLPGFVTQAKNPQELLAMLNDGILTYFDVPKKVGDIVHDQLTIDGYGTVSLGHQAQSA